MSSVGKNSSTLRAFFTGFGGIVREIRLSLVSTECLISHATPIVFRPFILDTVTFYYSLIIHEEKKKYYASLHKL